MASNGCLPAVGPPGHRLNPRTGQPHAQVYDLLNSRKKLNILEDGKKQVCVVGLKVRRVQLCPVEHSGTLRGGMRLGLGAAARDTLTGQACRGAVGTCVKGRGCVYAGACQTCSSPLL